MSPPKPPDTIALCIIGYEAGKRWILQNVRTCSPYVDEVNVQGNDFTPETVEEIVQAGGHEKGFINVWNEPWNEDFSAYKNSCANRATTGWGVHSDHDEVLTESAARRLRVMVAQSNGATAYNAVEFWAMNQTVHETTFAVLDEGLGKGKPLLHVNVKNPYKGDVHVWWAGRVKMQVRPAPDVDFAYLHIKERTAGIERSVRNATMGGGGNTEKGPAWRVFRKVVARHGILTHRQFWALLQQPEIPADVALVMENLFKEHSTSTTEDKKDPVIAYVWLHPDSPWRPMVEADARGQRWFKELRKLGFEEGHL